MQLTNWLLHLLARPALRKSRSTPSSIRRRERALARGQRRLERLEPRTVLASDFGDAPDTTSGTGLGNYQTLLANGGPSHIIDSTQSKLFLGVRVDGEANATPNATANGDDVGALSADDEDGVIDAASDLLFTVGTSPVVRVRASNTTGSTATLYGWIDFNRNGVFDNLTERASATVPTTASSKVYSLAFPAIPILAATGTTYARFRLSADAAAANPTGAASGGEVEDYTATITQRADTVADPSKTLKINNNLNGNPALPWRSSFGVSLSGLGDLNADGVGDVVIGASGSLSVQFMNANGTVSSQVTISNGMNGGPLDAHYQDFGMAVASIGDLDGDGATEIVAGDSGKLHVLFLSVNGQVKHSTTIASGTNGGPVLSDGGTSWVTAVASMGDLNGDGVTDIAIGNPASSTVYILMLNANGTVRSSSPLSSSTNGAPLLTESDRGFGRALASMGDLDGDGITDLAVGSKSFERLNAEVDDDYVLNDQGGGRILQRGSIDILFMNENGTAKRSVRIGHNTNGGPNLDRTESFASSLAAIGDLNGDGVTDLAVGVNDPSTRRGGTMYLLLMNSNGTAKNSAIISRDVNNGPHDAWFMGQAVASIGDLNGDGIVELAADTYGNGAAGAVYVLFLEKLALVDFGDAPDPAAASGTRNYRTRLADDGPTHRLDDSRFNLFLGTRVRGEAEAVPNLAATGDDDEVFPREEDGVIDPTQELIVTVGVSASVRLRATNTTGTQATLYGWMDFNSDGTFDDATERASIPVPAATTNRTFLLNFPTTPQNAVSGGTYARFRLSTDSAAARSTGAASDGEVEDYSATIARHTDGSVTNSKTARSGPDSYEGYSSFGSSVAALGDVDGDGIGDLAVGFPNIGTGVVQVQFMNSNGTIKNRVPLTNRTNGVPDLTSDGKFGSSVASLGDFDGTGGIVLAVGASNGGPRRSDDPGYVYLLTLNSAGLVTKYSVIRPAGGSGSPDDLAISGFGEDLAALGDLDGDGVTDLVVGAPSTDTGGPDRGAVYVLLMNTTGSVKRSMKIGSGINGGPILSDLDGFGTSVASLGDMDGDGVVDIAVGVPGDDTGGSSRGAMHMLFLNSDGTVKGVHKIASSINGGPALSNGDEFGVAASAVGDLDGNGVTDIVVGASQDDAGGTDRGAVHILRLNSNGSVKRATELASNTNGVAALVDHAHFGTSVEFLGDMNGDGVTELAVGAVGNNDVPSEVFVLFLRPEPTARLSESTNQITGQATITATLNGKWDENVLVDLAFAGSATSGSDYSKSTTQIVIPAGSTSASISLAFVPDTIDEPTETIVVSISSVTNGTELGTQRVTVSIEDDDPSPISVTRNNGVLTIANVAGIATDIRIGLDVATSRIQIESLTDGAVASVFRSPIEGLRGIVVNLGAQNDRFEASTILVPVTVNGGAGNDTIIGGAWTDLLNGDAGADSIIAGGGRDTVSGGAGDDTLDGGASIDLLMEVGDASFTLTSATLNGLGNDQLTGFEAANLTGGNSDNTIDASAAGFPVGINGGMGADTLLGSNFADTLNAGTGNDALFGYGGRDLLMGGAGNDVLDGGSSEDTLDGDTGTDTVRRKNDLNFTVTSSALIEMLGDAVLSTDKLSGVETVVIMGGPSANRIDVGGFAGVGGTIIQGNGGNDTVIGSDGPDLITTTDGDDSINARGGNDVVRSGAGADSIVGGAGNDLLDGEAGADTIAGEAGNDALIGGDGNDSLSGGVGVDVLAAVSGADFLSGGDGDDQLLGGDGAETLLGDDGNDRLLGAAGNDSLDGGAGSDSLQGEAGADTIVGGAGDDQLSGGANMDSIDGGEGNNRLNEVVGGNVMIEGTRITSVALGNESPLNINRIVLSGGAGDDQFDARLATVAVQLVGNAGNDILLGGRRADVILGGEGDDVISGGGAIDVLSGGNGFDDWLEEADANFTVNGITVTSEMTGSERVTDIERIAVIGGDRANMINASRAGVPVILIGGRGNDTLLGGSLADTLSGGNRGDLPINDGQDSLNGGLGVDVLENDLRDRLTLEADDSKIADIFTLLPSWIDAL